MPRPLVYVGAVILFFLILLAGTASVAAYAYRYKVYPNAKVGGISVAGLSREELNAKVDAQVAMYESHPVVVTVPDITQPVGDNGEHPTVSVQATASDLGLQLHANAAEEAAWNIARSGSFVQNITNGTKAFFGTTAIPLAYTIDSSKIDAFINTQVVPHIITPTPAKVVVTGDAVSITDAQPGLSIDAKKLASLLVGALPTAAEQDTIYIRAPVTEENSSITKTTLQPVADQLTKLGGLKLTLKSGSKTLKLTTTQVLSLYSLVQDDQGVVTIATNTDATTSFLKKNGGTELDMDPALKQVTEALTTSVTEVSSANAALTTKTLTLAQVPPKVTDVTAGDYHLGLFEGKYVEVNLKEQKLYRINGNTLEKVYRVSTGKWSTPTPIGTFTIKNKAARAYSATFGLYMPYWENFVGTDENGEELPVGSYGLHELPEWPSGYKEGASHIGTPVSHGCVRLGVGDAAEVYGWTEIGTPVYIHN